MADLFVKPYDSEPKPPKRLILTALAVLAVTVVVVGLWIWLDSRSAKAEDPKPRMEEPSVVEPAPPVQPPVAPVDPVASVAPAEPADPDSAVRQLFARAQSLVSGGSLEQADDLFNQVVTTAADEKLRNSALRVQGRIHVQRFLSTQPTSDKKSYVIQPGDSLDRIARQNKTTVEVIRKMNRIESHLIYPGSRLLLPSAPFIVRVDKSDRALDLTLNGKLFKRYIVGVGMNGKTPAGSFKTVVHQTNPDWTPPGGGIIPFGDPRNILGTRWISIQDSAHPDLQGFGIHGTSLRDSIGAETSNGCVRMLNEDVEELFLLIPRGTEVLISE